MSDTTETPQTPEELLTELAQLHIRTLVTPSPKQPAAFGWQSVAACQAAGFARALHALMEVAPDKAAEITDWYQGPFEEGPDLEEHTDWIENVVAKDVNVLEAWITEAGELAVKAAKATAAHEAEAVEHDAIHKHFGLSYANYLVLPRTLLQSMPPEWQSRFVTLLRDYDQAFEHVAQAEVYEVTAGVERVVSEMADVELTHAGIIKEVSEIGETRYFDGECDWDPEERVFLKGSDPVPHYNRGRTRVEPSLDGGQ